MIENTKKALLIGDNPFHQISHLSQERSRARGNAVLTSENAATLVHTALNSGANGFMFSVSDTTLSILRLIHEKEEIRSLDLYPIVPYAYDYVRQATQLGGIPRLARSLGKQIVMSGNIAAMAYGLRGIAGMDLASLMKTYLVYEVSRIKSSAGKRAKIESIILHELVTDVALALDLGWLFKEYVNFARKLRVKPGFNTCNFAHLVNSFSEWNIDLHKTVIAAPFNKAGFQMNPSREHCEKALQNLPEPALVAISILAAGYIKPADAISYLAALPNVIGAAVGVSKDKQAVETFRILREKLT
jgi:hypothetical protein